MFAACHGGQSPAKAEMLTVPLERYGQPRAHSPSEPVFVLMKPREETKATQGQGQSRARAQTSNTTTPSSRRPSWGHFPRCAVTQPEIPRERER